MSLPSPIAAPPIRISHTRFSMHLKEESLSEDVDERTKLFEMNATPKQQDIWEMTSPELICLAATDPRAIIKHIQDLGRELNMRVYAPVEEREHHYISRRAPLTNQPASVLYANEAVPKITYKGKHVYVIGE